MNSIRNFIVATIAAPLLVSCDPHELTAEREKGSYLDRQLILHEDRITKALKKEESEKLREESVSEKAAPAVAAKEARDRMLSELRESVDALRDVEMGLHEKVALLNEYQRLFRPRSLPEGTSFGQLRTVDGNTFENAVLRESLVEGVRIAHSGGFANLRYSQLPKEIASQFVFPPTQDDSDLDPLAVLGRKPDSLKSNEERSAEIRSAAANYEAKQMAEQEKRRTELEAIQAERTREAEKTAAARSAYIERTSALRARITQLESVVRAAQIAKDDFLYSSTTGSIRKSASDLARDVKIYDQKIVEAQKQLDEAQRELDSIPRP